MQFNQYSLYSKNTQDRIQEYQNKIFDDIKQMDKITEYQDILNFIEYNYGKIDERFEQTFADEVKLEILLERNVVHVFATQNDKILLGRKWIFTPNEKLTVEFQAPQILED